MQKQKSLKLNFVLTVSEIYCIKFSSYCNRKYIINNIKNQEYIKLIPALFLSIVISLCLVRFSYNNLFAIIVSALSFFVIYVTMLYLTKEKITVEIFNIIILRLKKVF